MSQQDQYLLVRRPGANPERVELTPDEACSVGRSPENRVVLTDSSVSRHHVRFFFNEGAWWVEDLGSKNGTWVSERRLGEGRTPLADGAVLRLGKVELVFLDSKEKGSTQTVAD